MASNHTYLPNLLRWASLLIAVNSQSIHIVSCLILWLNLVMHGLILVCPSICVYQTYHRHCQMCRQCCTIHHHQYRYWWCVFESSGHCQQEWVHLLLCFFILHSQSWMYWSTSISQVAPPNYALLMIVSQLRHRIFEVRKSNYRKVR